MTAHQWRSLFPFGARGHTVHDFYADAPEGVRVNMVASLDGAAAFGGRVRPISNTADHQLLRSLRAYCDVLLVGAGTIRAERYGPAMLDAELRRYRRDEGRQAALPSVAVVTHSGNLPGTPRCSPEDPAPSLSPAHWERLDANPTCSVGPTSWWLETSTLTRSR